MQEKDFRAILDSIDDALATFERGPPPTGPTAAAQKKLKELRETVLKMQQESARRERPD